MGRREGEVGRLGEIGGRGDVGRFWCWKGREVYGVGVKKELLVWGMDLDGNGVGELVREG